MKERDQLQKIENIAISFTETGIFKKWIKDIDNFEFNVVKELNLRLYMEDDMDTLLELLCLWAKEFKWEFDEKQNTYINYEKDLK